MQLDATDWRRVHKTQGKVIDTTLFTLSPDGRTLSSRTTTEVADGNQRVAEETFIREGKGAGLDGTWRSTALGVTNPDFLTISRVSNSNGLRFSYPDSGLTFRTSLNGGLSTYAGPGSVQELQVKVVVEASNWLRRTDMLFGRSYQEEIDTISADGRQLTVQSWHSADPVDIDNALYRRENE